MINVEALLKPVADDKPCGEDFTYHPSFQNLETISRGKPETQFSAAEEPEWKDVRDAAIELLGQSKHLSASVILTRALLKLDGLEGLRDGLAVVRGLTEKYWADVYPKLDPDDNNDPTERLNILNSLSTPKFAVQVGEVVLCASPTMGRITLQQVLNAKEKPEKPAGGEAGATAGPDRNQIQAGFRDAGPESAKATFSLVQSTIEQTQAIEAFLDTTLGSGRGVNFDILDKLLNEMKRSVEPHVLDGAAAGEPSPAGEASAPAEAGGDSQPSRAARGMAGSITTRADVIKALDLICNYYRQYEPSSPVPLILQRAHRLVDKDFLAIMSDLTPDALNQLQVITGAKTDK
jgi:type VI secretion system protein ImpA